jgi:hypothetical protein
MINDVSAFRTRKSVRASAGSYGPFEREATRPNVAGMSRDCKEHQHDGGERREDDCEWRRLKEA